MPFLGGGISQLRDFISFLGTVKGDLSNITAPPFILAPKSAIELPSIWASCHSLFLQPAREPDPTERALLVLKNYLCSLHYLVDQEGSAKKPLNPFLGELFLGSYLNPRLSSSGTRFIAEQVSHHPPVTACFIHNKELGISSTGFVAQETTFGFTEGVTVRQLGYAMIGDEKHGEKHLMTMPTLKIKGFSSGRTYVDLEGPCYISSSSGLLSTIDFKDSSMLGLGSRGRVTAELCRTSVDNQKEQVLQVEGNVGGSFVVRDNMGRVTEEFHVDDMEVTPLSVKPIEEQSQWESRKAWDQVVAGIRQGDFEKVIRHKQALEEEQRKRRAEELEDGTEWQTKFFWRCQKDEQALSLLQSIPGSQFDPEKTNGFWKVKDSE
ncbi:unnamed protein product [Clonostachys chloroleuca]|uniref:Oxysterol-binding protein n=1 Tax=Clonostachys chloroleuca TaxID=1926264 RepID=A0AA35Q8N3_9HYPO|nr:unnamed protein product [Clonostachys chloroleuca]